MKAMKQGHQQQSKPRRLLADLERLAKLRAANTLSELEFLNAKDHIFAESGVTHVHGSRSICSWGKTSCIVCVLLVCSITAAAGVYLFGGAEWRELQGRSAGSDRPGGNTGRDGGQSDSRSAVEHSPPSGDSNPPVVDTPWTTRDATAETAPPDLLSSGHQSAPPQPSAETAKALTAAAEAGVETTETAADVGVPALKTMEALPLADMGVFVEPAEMTVAPAVDAESILETAREALAAGAEPRSEVLEAMPAHAEQTVGEAAADLIAGTKDKGAIGADVEPVETEAPAAAEVVPVVPEPAVLSGRPLPRFDKCTWDSTSDLRTGWPSFSLNHYNSTLDYDRWVGTHWTQDTKFPSQSPYQRLIPREPLLSLFSCLQEEADGSQWHVRRVGPLRSTGDFDWWQFSARDVFNLSAAVENEPIFLLENYLGAVRGDGTPLGYPPIHPHHVHVTPQQVEQRYHDHFYSPFTNHFDDYRLRLIMESHGDYMRCSAGVCLTEMSGQCSSCRTDLNCEL